MKSRRASRPARPAGVGLVPWTVAGAGPRAQLLHDLMERVRAGAAAGGRSGFAGVLDHLLGAADPRLSSDEQTALWCWRARGDEPLARFARLYVLGQTLPRAAVAQLWGTDFDRAAARGLLVVRGTRVEAGLSLALHDGVPIFADPICATPGPEHVVGPTRATHVLARALPRTPVAEALELGTGAGSLALALAGRAAQVTATDVSARALGLAALNAALAGARNLTFLRSDRFARLSGRRFDLIAGNLPFVVSPERRYGYRDSGLAEDGFVASVVKEVGGHLVEGGFAVLLGQWVHREEEAEDERLAPWFVAAGCDALVLRLDAETIDTYAARWSAGPRASVDLPERLREIERWVLHLRRLRIHGLSTGLFVLRRRPAARHFMSIDEVSPSDPPPDWTEIAARLAALDEQAAVSRARS